MNTTLDVPETATVKEVRDLLRQAAVDGANCPCCKQRVKVYRRLLISMNARALIAMHVESGRDWVHIPTLMRRRLSDVAHRGGYVTMSQHWGLIEEATDERRGDGGRRGWWRLTDAGESFVLHGLRVPRVARIYNGRCLGLDVSEGYVSIQDVLGTDFDLQQQLTGRPVWL